MEEHMNYITFFTSNNIITALVRMGCKNVSKCILPVYNNHCDRVGNTYRPSKFTEYYIFERFILCYFSIQRVIYIYIYIEI